MRSAQNPDDIEEEEEEDLPEKTRIIRRKILTVEIPALQKDNRTERRMGRVLAVQALYAFECQSHDNVEEFVKELLTFDWDSKQKKPSKEFAALLIRGAIEIIDEIDERIIPFLNNWEWGRVSPINKAILRISIYQLHYRKDIPKTVIINEAIDLGKMFCEKDDYKFINAVLDKA